MQLRIETLRQSERALRTQNAAMKAAQGKKTGRSNGTGAPRATTHEGKIRLRGRMYAVVVSPWILNNVMSHKERPPEVDPDAPEQYLSQQTVVLARAAALHDVLTSELSRYAAQMSDAFVSAVSRVILLYLCVCTN